jgi:bifunctional DNA-binding transcriptional regulator/antitoxin component of YhaV-PrlF toxin-antitoxin module
MVKTYISSKGQTTIPVIFRKGWKTRQVIWEKNPDGSALVRPVADVMSLLGSAGTRQRRDPEERDKAQEAMADDAAGRGKAR